MDLQPTLEGELTILRPTVPEDWEGMYAAASDPLIWEVHPAYDRWQEMDSAPFMLSIYVVKNADVELLPKT